MKKTNKATKATKATKAVKKVGKKNKKTKKVVSKSVPSKTYLLMILDSSGSMDTIRPEAIEHFNEQVEKIQTTAAENMDVSVSLTTFATKSNFVLFNEPLSKLKPLTMRTYVPGGSTALFDAIGETLTKATSEFKDLENENTACLVVIVTDGAENASNKFNRESVAGLIKILEASGKWTFTYLGANHDVEGVARTLNIPVGNTSRFVSTSAGTQAATAQSVNSLGNYMVSRAEGLTRTASYYSPSSPSDSEPPKK